MTAKQEFIIKIEGMSCGHCKDAVEKALRAVPGVEQATVDLAANIATVSGQAELSALQQAIEDIGFDVVQ